MVNNQTEIPIRNGNSLIFRSNPFRFLYLAAKSLIKDAKQDEIKNDRETEVNHSIGAIVVLLLSTEALINRVYEEFIRGEFPKWVYEEITNKWSFTMKWYFAPLLFKSGDNDQTFEVDREPWQSFSELKKIRDYFAHPKSLRYSLTIQSAEKKTVDFTKGDLPRWPKTKIPKDLNHLRMTDAQKVLESIKQMIDKLDSFMDGIIKKDNWYLTEQMSKKEKRDE